MRYFYFPYGIKAYQNGYCITPDGYKINIKVMHASIGWWLASLDSFYANDRIWRAFISTKSEFLHRFNIADDATGKFPVVPTLQELIKIIEGLDQIGEEINRYRNFIFDNHSSLHRGSTGYCFTSSGTYQVRVVNENDKWWLTNVTNGNDDILWKSFIPDKKDFLSKINATDSGSFPKCSTLNDLVNAINILETAIVSPNPVTDTLKSSIDLHSFKYFSFANMYSGVCNAPSGEKFNIQIVHRSESDWWWLSNIDGANFRIWDAFTPNWESVVTASKYLGPEPLKYPVFKSLDMLFEAMKKIENAILSNTEASSNLLSTTISFKFAKQHKLKLNFNL